MAEKVRLGPCGAVPRALMAEIEQALSGALPYAGKGLLPMPFTLSSDPGGKVLAGVQSGSLAVIASKADMAVHVGGDGPELSRMELTPKMRGPELPSHAAALHDRLLTAAGIPLGLVSNSGNSGASREACKLFVLGTLSPLARVILPELKARLGVSRLSVADLTAADMSGRSHADASLVQSGVRVLGGALPPRFCRRGTLLP